MFRQSIRRFGTTAVRAVEASTPYHVRVSGAQGFVNGLTEGTVHLPCSPPIRPYTNHYSAQRLATLL